VFVFYWHQKLSLHRPLLFTSHFLVSRKVLSDCGEENEREGESEGKRRAKKGREKEGKGEGREKERKGREREKVSEREETG
jgi:hypothetical protein